MKISLILLQFIVALLLFHCTKTYSSNLKSKTKLLSQKFISQISIPALWEALFTENRVQSCARDSAKANTIFAAKPQGRTIEEGVRSRKAEFSWIKKWGYDESAYLFDFFDPILQPLVVDEFQKLYDELMAFSNTDTNDYKDLLDFKKVSEDNQHLKNLNRNYDKDIYALSANSVQLHSAMKKWNWYIDHNQNDYAMEFILKYDFNGDGRLNPRELIIGAIMHHRNYMITGTCQHCFQGIGKTLDAMFLYMDCTNDGFLTAEQLWQSLPKLNRGTDKWNIFAIQNSNNIRTSAINDFVIKNGNGKEGQVSRDDFKLGVLLGYWDRQTSMKSILNDDSRNLKHLRWDGNGMKDTIAYKYLEEKSKIQKLAKIQ